MASYSAESAGTSYGVSVKNGFNSANFFVHWDLNM